MREAVTVRWSCMAAINVIAVVAVALKLQRK
jgi:hypothetical protein